MKKYCIVKDLSYGIFNIQLKNKEIEASRV